MSITRILSLKKQFTQISQMNSDKVKEIQKEKIDTIVKTAIWRSPFYKHLYGNNYQFFSLPFVDKTMIMQHFNDVVTDKRLQFDDLQHHIQNTSPGTLYQKEFKTISTSGSSGKKGIFVYDSLGWDTLKALVLARCTDFSIIKRKRMAFIGAVDGHYAGVSLASDVPRILASYTHVSVHDSIGKIVTRLNEFKPNDIRGYPTGLAILASEKLAGRLNIQPQMIVSSAEPLDEKTKDLIIDAFNIAPYNFYAASESIGIAQDCSKHEGLHVFNDAYVVEIVDEQGNPVDDGKSGNIVLTNLYNTCQPLIRYQMNDRASYAEEECSCGLPFPLLKNIEGRVEESIWIEKDKGYEVLHMAVFLTLSMKGVQRIQVHQRQQNVLRILAVVEKGKNEDEAVQEITKKISAILVRKNLQDDVTFDVEIVDTILPDNTTGKTKTVVSLGRPQL